LHQRRNRHERERLETERANSRIRRLANDFAHLADRKSMAQNIRQHVDFAKIVLFQSAFGKLYKNFGGFGLRL
jgi:hypothetical protein